MVATMKCYGIYRGAYWVTMFFNILGLTGAFSSLMGSTFLNGEALNMKKNIDVFSKNFRIYINGDNDEWNEVTA